MNHALDIRREDAGELITPAAITPLTMLNNAIEKGVSPEVLEKLLAVQERWEQGQARKAFDAAMSEAKAEIPVISKNRHVGFDSKKAGASRTDYRHEDLAEIARTVDPILSKNGLSYRFRTTSEPNQPISVTCIVSHRLGHSEENTLTAGRDDSGNKNSIQAIGSTITYLQRYTLKSALGLAASNDDDGRQADNTAEDGPISDEQAATIRRLAEETGTDLARFCTYFKIEAVPDLPAAQFQRAVQSLEKKRGAQ